MKGLISGIKRMEIHDGDGLRTTVFFKGCPLKCIWCHNPESIGFRKQIAYFAEKCMHCGICRNERTEESVKNCPTEALKLYGTEYEAEELAEILLQDKVFFDSTGGGVTFSGGECLAQPEFALELAGILTEKGVRVNIDTCGFVKREILEQILPYTDCFLYDLKAIEAEVHRKCTGRDNSLILENLKFLAERGCRIEIRYPLVKGCNDGECEKIGAFLQKLPGNIRIKVLQYHSFAASRYKALGMVHTLPDSVTTAEDVEAATERLKKYGLQIVKE